jgi:hypothetical protein
VRPDPIVSASPSAKDAAPVDPPPDFGSPDVVTLVPVVPGQEKGSMDHADVFGWSKDGAVFGYCMTDGGMGARHCELWPRAAKPELFDDVDPATQELDPKKTAAIEARMKKLALAVTMPKWDYARDIELVWIVVEGDAMSKPTRPGILKVGGRLRHEGEPPAYVIQLSETSSPYYADIHPEAIAVSPDGQLLGAIGHAFAGEFSDAFQVAVVPMAKVAAAAYDAAARAHQAKGDTAMATELFRKAKAVH